ncbi:hypothetical protein MXD95_017510 [Frankia sp. AiPa1]|nr:hypothetical protein [Frankia sp. AiPa1]
MLSRMLFGRSSEKTRPVRTPTVRRLTGRGWVIRRGEGVSRDGAVRCLFSSGQCPLLE